MGRFTVLRQTIRKRLQTKLNAVKAELQRRMHDPSPTRASGCKRLVRGHIRYYGVPRNHNALWIFRFQVGRPLVSRAVAAQPERTPSLGSYAAPSLTVGCHCLLSVIPILLRRMGVIT